MTVFIEDSFDAAHSLPHLPPSHKCHRLHGHTYRIRIELTGPVDPVTRWVLDYADVKRAWGAIKEKLDHHFLNERFQVSTCETVIEWIWGELKIELPQLSRVELRETERCGCVLSL